VIISVGAITLSMRQTRDFFGLSGGYTKNRMDGPQRLA